MRSTIYYTKFLRSGAHALRHKHSTALAFPTGRFEVEVSVGSLSKRKRNIVCTRVCKSDVWDTRRGDTRKGIRDTVCLRCFLPWRTLGRDRIERCRTSPSWCWVKWHFFHRQFIPTYKLFYIPMRFEHNVQLYLYHKFPGFLAGRPLRNFRE